MSCLIPRPCDCFNGPMAWTEILPAGLVCFWDACRAAGVFRRGVLGKMETKLANLGLVFLVNWHRRPWCLSQLSLYCTMPKRKAKPKALSQAFLSFKHSFLNLFFHHRCRIGTCLPCRQAYPTSTQWMLLRSRPRSSHASAYTITTKRNPEKSNSLVQGISSFQCWGRQVGHCHASCRGFGSCSVKYPVVFVPADTGTTRRCNSWFTPILVGLL